MFQTFFRQSLHDFVQMSIKNYLVDTWIMLQLAKGWSMLLLGSSQEEHLSLGNCECSSTFMELQFVK